MANHDRILSIQACPEAVQANHIQLDSFHQVEYRNKILQRMAIMKANAETNHAVHDTYHIDCDQLS